MMNQYSQCSRRHTLSVLWFFLHKKPELIHGYFHLNCFVHVLVELGLCGKLLTKKSFLMQPSHATNCAACRGWYHVGRRLSSDDSFHSPTVIPPLALDKPSIMKCYHHWRMSSHTSPRRSPTMVTLLILGLSSADCEMTWNDGCTVESYRHFTVVSLHDTGPRFLQLAAVKYIRIRIFSPNVGRSQDRLQGPSKGRNSNILGSRK